MQRILACLALFLLVGAQSAEAVRVLKLLERSYELRLSDVTLPLSSSGSVTFKACDECSLESVPVTVSTRYYLHEQEISLSQLNEQARLVRQQLGAATSTLLMLHYDIDTKRATRLVLKTYPAR